MRTNIVLVASTLVSLLPCRAEAQPYGELDARRWGLVYNVPATSAVTVRRNVPYRIRGTDTLAIDVYAPPRAARVGGSAPLLPVVVFVNAVGDERPDRVKNWAIYRDWPRLVAAHGMIGISMDAERDSIQSSLHALFSMLSGGRAAALGIDSTRIGLYAASANVGGTLQYLGSGRAPAAIRAAALYYGGVPQQPLPRIPTLVVVAQGDVPRMRPHLDSLWKAVIDSAAPWTLHFGRSLPHAFDALTANDDARRTIQQTIAFWRSHLEPVPGSGAAVEPARRIVEAAYAGEDARSIALLSDWTAAHPSDTTALQMLGRALQGARRNDEAERAFLKALALDSNSRAAKLGLGQLRFNARRWAEAAQLLEGVTRSGYETSLIRGQLGFAYLSLGRHADGAREYERAFALGMPPGRAATGVAAYNLAAAYARLGRGADAIAMLTRAVDNGMTNRASIEADEDFASLRSDPQFQALLARIRAPER
jgi:Flp pilus assembly protein TadD